MSLRYIQACANTGRMTDQFEGFVPIHTLFYAVFHPTKGTQVRYEYPPGNLEYNNINFDAIKNYIIPKPQLCHKLLTLKYKGYRIVCYPVTVNSPYYARNFFSFNFVFVFPYDCETSSYEPAIARLGKMFRVLEEQNQILSKAENDPIYFDFKLADNTTEQDGKLNAEKSFKGLTKSQGMALAKYNEIMKDLESEKSDFSVQDLVMRIFQDLNNYSECLIPIDEGNAVDIKIFPLKTPPNSCISIEDVPISTVNLKTIIDVNWDPTMLKIVPYIDGLNSISKIAKLSDSDVSLVLECVKHLVYYNCVILADIFQFSNIYAPTSLIRQFLTDPTLASECQSHVTLAGHSSLSEMPFERLRKFDLDDMDQSKNQESGSRTTSMSSKSDSKSKRPFFYSAPRNPYRFNQRSQSSFSSTNTNVTHDLARHLPTKACLFDLYRTLSQGVTVREWYNLNYQTIKKNDIDVRRFITFGVIKGLIYRCFSFPVMKKMSIFDLAHKLHTAGNLNQVTKKGKGQKNLAESKYVFSTSDMKLGEGSKMHQNFSVDIADEVLRNVYKKLSNTNEPGSRDDYPLSRIYREESHVSLSALSGDNVSHPKKPERVSKVAFDMNKDDPVPYSLSQQKGKNKEREAAKLDRAKNNQKIILLESIAAADCLDKICVKLEKPRHEVEELLHELGDYKIINS
ncbi:hypothetical protein ZYGR_0I03280 [Zygosaccharomyces rouxii]|uniref:ZYRO0C07876p n=2 Tax=Zygosaccharomyces rouxii TaxID=4956 RepID=C5DTE4_ZYGRC|nr:uncharacterized protein ZYRO0C07876g [Zygosaccharomyces rouxii]KAH9201764.1 nitrogen permease regulator 2-domain-containing protein [Zygosaccharomyces rouxii]GAV48031.1 hypothetical protein ZYGR_0I03280 [Zygosaccharomyces rouxii]CAR27055.1 ZYRO0C07876p [Zygosaccharomyces rouxii]